MGRRTIIAVLAATAALIAGAVPASAMGSGNPYLDMQTGVTYTVYQPTFAAGLKLQHAGGNTMCPEGTDENLLTAYGTRSTQQFTITQGNPMCSDIGVGRTVLRTTVLGARAEVVAYCDPASTKKCTKADVQRYGGHLSVNLPARPGLRPTTLWIETFSAHNVSAETLLRIARHLVAVSG